MSSENLAALVGTTGGAGTTRTAVELATTLARDGRSVAIFDAAYATQGLADYVDGRIDPDVTKLVTGEASVDAALYDLSLPSTVEGRVACCPADAPFERLARAKTQRAARAFESRLADAATNFDHVLIDTPPIAANQAVAAVTAADRVVAVTPGTPRGADALQRIRDRLVDLDTALDAILVSRGDLSEADAAIPEASPLVADAPVCLDDDEFARSTVEAAEAAVETTLDIELEEAGLVETVEQYVPNR